MQQKIIYKCLTNDKIVRFKDHFLNKINCVS